MYLTNSHPLAKAWISPMPSICFEAEVGSSTVVWITLFTPCLDFTWYFRKIQNQPQGCQCKWCHVTWMCIDSKLHCSTLRDDSCTLLGSPSLVGHRTTGLKCGHVASLPGTGTLPSEIDLGLPSIDVPEIDTRLHVDSPVANFHHCLDLLNCIYNPRSFDLSVTLSTKLDGTSWTSQSEEDCGLWKCVTGLLL